MAVAIDLDGAYNRIQFNQLMDLLMQSEDNLTLARWIAGALLERTVGMQLGTGALLFIRTQWAYQKDHRYRRSFSMSTPKA